MEYSSAVNTAGTKTHTLLRVHNPEGYSDNFNNSFMSTYFYYFRRDHLGNTREVWRAPFIVYAYGNRTDPAMVMQRTQYYPSGLPWSEGLVPDYQPYKYNGKEFVEMNGLDTYDYGWRGMYPAICRFNTVDPMAEKYYSISPYAYCGNNPINLTDPTGCVWDSTQTAMVQQMNTNITNQSTASNNQIAQINANPGAVDANGNPVLSAAQQAQVSELQFRVNDLTAASAEIASMGADQNHYYTLNPMAAGDPQITADPNNISNVTINYLQGDVGNQLHEVKHGYQVTTGNLGFAVNNGQISVTNYDMGDEVQTWTRQYSYTGLMTGNQAPAVGSQQYQLNTLGGFTGTANQINSQYSITNHSQITIPFLRGVTVGALGNQRLYNPKIP